MSKKILSIALAVVMLFSVVACVAGAANTTVTTTFPTASQGGFRVVSDAYVGMGAGETVTVKVYWVHPYDTDFDTYRQSWGNVVICYTDAFDYDVDSRTWGDSYSSIFKAGNNVNANNATYNNTVIGKLSTADKAYGWTQAMLVNTAMDTSSGYSPNSGFPVDKDCEIFSVQFTTTREVTADDSFGLPSHLAGTTTLFAYSSNNKRATYKAAATVIEDAAKALVVANSDTATAKMRPGAVAGTVDLGITGAVKDVSFNPGKTPVLHGNGDVAGYVANNLANVGVQVRVNGVVAAAEGTCIYATDGGFNYRPAITGIDADGLDDYIEVRTYITDVNGNTYFSNWMNIDATAVHDNAVGNGMTGIA